MKKPFSYILFSFFMLVIFSCNNQTADKNPDDGGQPEGQTEESAPSTPVLNYGFQEGGKYYNDYFGVEMTVPDSWYVQSREENEILENIGRETAGQGGESQPSSTPIGELQVIYLISALEFDPGTSVDYNPGINVIANNLTESDESLSNQVYMEKLRDQLMTFPNFTLNEAGISETTLGGKSVVTMEAETKLGEILIKQTYFANIVKDYAIQFTISYTDDTQKESLMKILETVKFE